MNRIYNLDYLRGLAAFGIMIYHYMYWSFGEFDASDFMGRLGTYGVSIFYILSGLTLYYVYYHKMSPTKSEVGQFFKKRVFRIFPLLWLITIVAMGIDRHIPEPYELFLNLSGLFSVLKWDGAYATGVWSIGNELSFYLFFPFFVLFAKRFKVGLVLLTAVLAGLYFYFAFSVLDTSKTMGDQWKNYVNPLNQVFLFLGGFLMGLFFQKVEVKNSTSSVLLVLGLVVFIFYPATGDAIELVTGVNRLIFTASSFLICFSFYKLSLNVPTVIHKPLATLGEISYSVYLVHPLVFAVFGFVNKSFLHLNKSFTLLTCVVITLIAAFLVYQYFEKFFMKLGRGKAKVKA